MEIIKRIYPNHKVIGMHEIFVPFRGWYSVLIGCGMADALEKDILPFIQKGIDSKGRPIEKAALILEDNDGFRKIADFAIKELQT